VPRESRKDVRFQDSVYGDQSKETADIEDFALLRRDGTPYWFRLMSAQPAPRIAGR